MALSDATRPRATPLHFKAIADRKRAADQIEAGRLPTLDELYRGLGFASGDWKLDLTLWCADLMLDPQMTEYADVIRHARSTCSIHALEALRDALTHEHVTDLGRLDLYLTAAGDDEGHARAVLAILSDPFRPDPYRVVFGLALARDITAARDPGLISRGKSAVRSAAADIDALDAAEHQMKEDPDQARPSPEEHLHAQIAELAAAIEEDRAEIDPEIVPPLGLIVVPAEAVTATKHSVKKEILAGYVGIVGAPLPWIETPDLGVAVAAMESRLPHAVDVFQRILGALQPAEPVRYRPTLLVGPAGTGKTTLARTIAEILGQPVEVHGMAGASDASIMGTSAQWHTARESVVLQLIRRTRVCNPLVVFDEIEKVGEGRNNGNASEALLPLLEAHTARAIRDPALEVPVDLSLVSYIATANSLEGIPTPLKDRFNVIRMPEPTWQHIGAISRGILDRVAQERGLRPEWFPDLEPDELEVIKKIWPGGSIRRLEQAVRRLVDGRDAYMGRA